MFLLPCLNLLFCFTFAVAQISLESQRAQAVESALSDAISQTADILSVEVSRAAAATDAVLDEAQLQEYFNCEQSE